MRSTFETPSAAVRAACALAFLLAAALAGCGRVDEQAQAPFEPAPVPELAGSNFSWGKAKPASQGLRGAKLRSLGSSLMKRRTKSFVVIRNDKIVYQKYASNYSFSKKHHLASGAKAIVTAVALALARSDARIAPDQLASDFIARWQLDPLKALITVRQLAEHTSGLADAEHVDTGWEADFWNNCCPDPFTVALDQAPMLTPPGTQWSYSNPGFAALGYAVTAALDPAGDRDLRSLLANRVMDPIGAAARQWSIGYNSTFEADGLLLVPGWGGAGYSPDAAARVARLLLRDGDWQGQALIASDAAADRVGWWRNDEGRWPSLPADAFVAIGAGDEVVLAVPSWNMLVIRFGGWLDRQEMVVNLEEYLFAPLAAAVK